MKDERIESKLAVIKKTVFFFWTLIALLFVVVKSAILKSLPQIHQGLTEYTVFTLSLVTLIIHRLLTIKKEILDERINFLIEKMYSIAFKIIIIGAIIAYFVQLLTLTSYLIGVLPINSFINFFFGITFLVYYLSARKQGIYFNYKIIENPNKEYLKSILKQVFIILFVGAFFYLLLYLVDFFNLIEIQVIEVTVAIGLSVLITSIEYIMLSIYEWNHYQESLRYENGQTVLISKNYFLFSMIVMAFFTVMTLFNLFTYPYILNYQDYPFISLIIVQGIQKLLLIYSFDMMLIQLLLILILNHSLKRSLPHEMKIIKTIMITEIIFLTYSFFQTLFSVFVTPFLGILLSSEQLVEFMQTNNYISYIMLLSSLLIPILMFRMFTRNHFRYASLYIIVIVAQVLINLLPLIINRVEQINGYNIIYTILYLSSTITRLIIFCLASKEIITIPIPKTEQFA